MSIGGFFRKLKMPTAFTILFIILVLSAFSTWVIPAGSYAKLKYDADTQQFSITHPDGRVESAPATKEELQARKISIDLGQFTEGKIRKAVSVPDTYQRLESKRQGAKELVMSIVNGTIEAADIMVFVLILGGMIGIVNANGAFEAGLTALTKRTKGREFILVFFVSIFTIFGGTSFGMAEETVAFYPILCPIFIALGYDSLVCVGAVLLASTIGNTYTTVNPFAVVIASGAAGIPFTNGISWRIIGLILGSIVVISYLYWYAKKVKANPEFSYAYEDREDYMRRYPVNLNSETAADFTARKKIILCLFIISFFIMIYGVVALGWWFPEMASSFLAITLIMMFITNMGEEKVIGAFMRGASDLVSVALIIGVARGINIILENGMISDTILNYASSGVAGMSSYLFVIVMYFVFFILGFVVPSSSGLAVLSMPVMAPLADTAGIDRSVIISAYIWGQNTMSFIAPTGMVLVTSELTGMKYTHWLRFIFPIFAYVMVASITFLLLQVAFA